MSVPEFKEWPKIPRLFKDCTITEKLDGTNAQVYIDDTGVYAGSRNRWLTVESDNFGFARWVKDNEAELRKFGNGRFFGEWRGEGIQRRYGVKGKVFSVFNPDYPEEMMPSCVSRVPVLYRGPFCTEKIKATLESLAINGSLASPGFMRPEGVIVYHHASAQKFKYTLEQDKK